MRPPQPVLNATSAIAQALYTLGSSALVFQLAGAEAFGVWALLVAFRGIIVFVEGGLALGVARDATLEAAGATDARGRIAAALRVYLILAAVAIGLGLAATPLPSLILDLSGELAQAASIATILIAVETALVLGSSPLLAIMRGRERFDLLALGSSANAILGLVMVGIGTARAGLVGAAAASMLARLLVTIGYYWWLQARHGHLLSLTAQGEGVTHVVRFAAPIWLVSVGTQVGLRLQIPITGALHGAVAAGHVAAGSTLAILAAGFLWVILDTAYPSLARASRERASEAVPALVFIGTALGAAGFAAGIGHAGTILILWLGTEPPTAVRTFQLFSVAWMINVPTHVLALSAMARGIHAVLAPVVAADTIALVILTAVLTTYDALGPAVATVAVYTVSNLLVLPYLLGRRLGVSLGRLLGAGTGGALVGTATAGMVWLALQPLGLGPRVALAATVAALALATVAFLRLPAVRTYLG